MIFREPSILFHRDFTLKKYNGCITAAGAGRVSATAVDDGLVANDGVLISGGTLAVTSGGGSANTAVKTGNAMFGGWDAGTAEEETTSMKGVKAQTALEITGGTLTLDTADDSLHSNGTAAVSGGAITALTVSGGTVLVSGPTDGANSIFDSGTSFTMNGGVLLGTGSQGMLETPGEDSAQNTLSVSCSGEAGSVVEVQDADGGMQAPDNMQQPGGRAF